MSLPPRLRLESLELRVDALEKDIHDLVTKQNEVLARQDALLLRLARYEGDWGMLIMVATALWSALLLFKEKLLGKF